jgi:predicted small secreted protein
MQTNFRTLKIIVLATALLLAGCSSMRLVDSDVNTFPTPSAQSVTVPATYRFERLPSEQAEGPARDALESLAQPELAKVGLQRADAAPQYSVQLNVRVVRDLRAPWDEPRYTAVVRPPYPTYGPYGTVWRTPGFGYISDIPYYRREVHLVVRRIADTQVVFESRANHDGRWRDDQNVLPAMLQAALQGFPNSAAGLRRVVVEIPR